MSMLSALFSLPDRAANRMRHCARLFAALLAIVSWKAAVAQDCGDVDSGSCCVAHVTPACDAAACCALVCAMDPYCCSTSWDALCVEEAFASCGLLCNEPPGNDHCEDRITVGEGVTPFDNTYADTDGIPSPSCGQIYNDVWFNYEATCDGVVLIQARQIPDGFPTPLLAVYSGCDTENCPPSAELDCAYGSVLLAASAGDCFKIRAGVDFDGGGDASELRITCYPTPVNDTCAGRIPISAGETSYSNFAATTDGLTTTCGQIFNDLWFNYESTCDGTLKITTDLVFDEFTTFGFSHRVAVYAGCEAGDCPPASEIACGTGPMYMEVESGQCYKIRVGGSVNGFPSNGLINIECLTQPANDDCTDRIEIGDGETSFSTVGATTDGLPTTSCGQINHDIWYNYTATCTGTLLVYSTTGPESPTVPFIALYAGCDTGTCPPAAELDCGWDSTQPLAIPVTEGECIKLRAGSPYSNLPVSGSITIECLEPIANDDCADRIEILDGPTPFHLFLATTDGPAACSFIADDIWFNYTATCDGVLEISRIDDSNFTNVVVVYDGCDCPIDGSSQLVCGGITSPQSGSSSIFVPVTFEQCYKIRLGGFGQEFAGTINLTCLTPPTNDDCIDREEVGNGTFPIDLSAATTDGPLTTNCFSFQNDIWFNYTADCDGILTASALTNFGAQVAIYDAQGTDCVCPTDDYSEQTCAFGTAQWPVVDGNCYKIRVGAFGSGPNSGTLTLSCTEAPENDLCENRIEVFDGETPIDLTAATLDGSPFSPCVHEASNDIWFNYTATCDGAISVFASTVFFSALPLEVYEGCDTVDCPPVSIPNCGGVIDVTAGACYKIRVMTPIFQTASQGTLSISCATPTANDDCDLREDITDGTTSFNTIGATNDGPDTFSCAHLPPNSGDVWFNYTATCTGVLDITLAEDDPFFLIFHYMFVYSGCDCPTIAGSEIACGNRLSPINLNVIEGECYKIRISSGFQQRAVGTITLSYPDTDGDGTVDCQDGCRLDPDKIEPGICGCGVPDTDTDGDNLADCIDSDDDNDGIPDEDKPGTGTDPLDPDTDDDGVGDLEDCAPLDGDIYAGAPCDDGDPCTINDLYDKDCNCAGSCEITAPAITCPPDVTVACIEDAAPGLPFGSVDGVVGIYYNDNGDGEVPANQAYLRSQFSDTNSNGGQFTFSSIPLTGNGLTWSAIFNELGQYGLDLVLPVNPDGSVMPPVLIAVDNADNTPGGAIPAGPVAWAINDYKDDAPNGPGNPNNAPTNSVIRGDSPPIPGDIVITRNDVTESGGIYTAEIEGYLVSDGVIHWYTIGQPDSPMSSFNLTGTFYFAGTLTYDVSLDPYPLIDFYEGKIEITANAPASAVGFATATDDCTPFPFVGFFDSDNGGSGCAGEPLIITRTWFAIDACGNESECEQVITVEDDQPPVFLSVPADVEVILEAGECSAEVEIAPATATDNCGAPLLDPPLVTFARSDGEPGLDDPYLPGDTTITWTATDACGNEAIETTTVTVDAVDELDLTVELQNVSAGPFTRCIHIELHDCLGGEPHVIEQTMTFSGGVASAELEIPCGEWVCITARDPLHTLRSTVEPLSVSGQQYIASFTGAEALRGGNLNDPASNVIDIFDFGAFAGEFNENYGSGNTDCDDVPPHADISGDGVVFVEDYTFIVNNFLDVSEPNCCGLGGIAGGDEPPVISISVAELEAMGLGSYAAGDLNGDGWLNPIDMQLFADGVWPTDDSTVREVSFTGASGGSWFDPANWSDGLLPDDQADVAIDVNVTIDDGEAIARHIDINSGAALSIANSGSIAAMSITVHGGGMLALDDASALITADSLVIDHGAMLAWHSGVIAADLVNSGVIELGNPLAQLMLDAEFTQLLPGVLAIDIAGELDSMHDALIVTGPAHLGGTLEVRLLEGYVPAIDSKITSVIEAQIIMGQFDQVIPPDQLLPGVFQHLAISETAVHIIYSDEPQMPADLDGDGVIGSADLAELLSQWGECLLPLPPGEGGGEGGTDSGGVPALCTADFNADGVIDSADLAQLLSAWSN
jgi:hypothetical protein